MDPVLVTAILTNVATLGIGAAVFIPLARAVSRRLEAPRADAERIQALEAELEVTRERLHSTEERLTFVERLLQKPSPSPALSDHARSDRQS